ncbi:MAG TPA: dihydrolipoamide acetyltransferase family protein [Xanthobacteraceae bacterium]|jgi:pyruvate dehydrogenase E2 component (dihydrolipoamide acetyltransferase)
MDVLMPQLGETVAEGKITRWFKSAGDAVAPGDNLFEIETDKVSMEVPSTSAGVLSEIRVQAGEVAPVGAVVAVIADQASTKRESPAATEAARAVSAASGPLPKRAGGGAQADPVPAAVRGETAPERALRGQESERHEVRRPGREPLAPIKLDPFFEVRTPARNFGPARLPDGRMATPLARRLAAQAGIELRHVAVAVAVRHGRISARDVEATARAMASEQGVAQRLPIGSAGADTIKALYRNVPFEEVLLDGMRRTIAARLLEAKQTIPHFYLTADIEIGRLIKLREEVNAAAPKDCQGNPPVRVSVTDLVIKAWAAALQRVPAANAAWAGDRILRFGRCDIGVAVAVEGGLLAPVIRGAEAKTLSAISTEMRELAARARARKLAPSEYQGGASTISNLGMHGVREFSAIINPPQATILAIGAARRQAVETDTGAVRFTSVMSVTLSCDHRVIDGALGAELIASFRGLLEQPITMLI